MSELALVNVRGQPLVEKNLSDVRFTANGPFQPTALFTATDTRLRGAKPNPRRHDYKLYIDMYNTHWLIRAAIDKKVSVATNTGWDFVPRDTRMKEVPEEQANRAADFFGGQSDFLDQIRSTLVDLELFGDAFLYVVPDRRRRPKRLKHLAPWTMHIRAKENGEVIEYIQTVGETIRVYKPHEIIHFRHVNPDDDIYGLSRLEAIKNTVVSDLYAEAYNLNFFKNGASTGTMFIIKNATQQELELNRTWIRDEYVGTNNSHRPIILAGDVDVKKSVASHQDMGFLEGRDANTRAILAALDVPPAKVGIMESANRSNSKEQDKSFRTEAIMPLQSVIETGLTSFIGKVLGCPDVQFKFSEGDIRDAQEQMDLWEKAAKTGFMTINEVRARMGLPKIEGGDIAIVMTPTGAVPVVDLELYFTLAQTNVGKIPQHLHDDHEQAHDAHGEVGPVPKPSETDTDRITGQKPATKSMSPLFALDSALAFIGAAGQDEQVFKHVLTYVMDAADEAQDPVVDQALSALNKARRLVDDDDIRQTYIERATALLSKYKEGLDGQTLTK